MINTPCIIHKSIQNLILMHFSIFSDICHQYSIPYISIANYKIQKNLMSLGSVSDLIQYFNLNRHIFQKQKTNKQHMQRIMSMLSQQNMEILEQEFQLYPSGLELPTFLYLMKKLYSPQNQISKYYFVSDLIKFFQAIDINGDGHLEWSEFTEYIIENIRRIDKPNYKNKVFQENQVISSAYSKISNQYKIMNVIDTGTTNCIKKILYIPKEQKYYLLESGSNLLRIFDAKFALVDFLQLKGQSHHSFIVDFSFDRNNMIFCAIFQSSARFCNLKVLGNVKTCNQCQVKRMGNYHKVQFLPVHGYWAFLSKHGDLKLCTASYRSRTAIDFSLVAVLRQHESLITDICEIQEPLYIVTASMDGNIKYYSDYLKKSITLEHVAEQTSSAINAKYKKGVLGIDYTREFGSYILSYGFCSAIYVYSLDVSLVKGFTGKYKQHGGNLISAKFLKSFPYVLSFDDKLNMRIWDFRRFQTIQIINCQKNFINPSRLQLIPELSQCLVCEKKITQFRAPSLQKKSKEINQFHVIFDFRICSMTNNIFLFTSNDVRVYNYITGSLEKVFTKLNQTSYDTNITACQFGYKSRKFFVGDAAGFVREYCSQTGDFLQEVQPGQDNQYENKAIVRIIFLKEHSLLIVCTLDGRIMIYQRNSESQFEIIRDMRETHFQLTCAEASARYCTLATGSQDGTVNIWNLEKLALEGVLVLPSKIIHISFSPIHPVMLVVQDTGIISGFYIRPHQDTTMRNKCFIRIMNHDPTASLRRITSINFQLIINAYMKKGSALTNNTQHDHHLICAIGSDDGSIRVANLTEIIAKFGIQQNHQIFAVKKSIKCEIHTLKTTLYHERKKILASGYSNANVQQFSITSFPNNLRFEAHKDRVDKLLLVKENSIILSTCSADKKLKLWSLEGELNGAIDFFTFKKMSWKVAEMNFYKKIQAIDTTIYSMKLIQNKKLSAEQEEFIRINLLINEYMNQQEKEDYFQWVSVLKRRRMGKRANTRHIKCPSKILDDFDARDQIAKFDNLNGAKKTPAPQDVIEQAENVEFYQIYSKLVNKIKNRLDKPEFPSIEGKREPKVEQREKQRDREVNIGEFISTLRKTLRINQEQQKKYEKQFALAMNKKVKYKKKPNNLLYQSLVQVRKNIEAMQKKQTKTRKVL